MPKISGISKQSFKNKVQKKSNNICQKGDHTMPLPKAGLLNLFVQHTSCALTINENADPDVRSDMEKIMNHMVKENEPYYDHVFEGADDMPAHAKCSLFGVSITIPITNGRLNLGTWQGIYLCEFRDYGGARKIVATIYE